MNKHLDKIKKLLALAKSTNPHEAALALQRAIKLMKQHELTERDIELAEISKSESVMGYNSIKIPRHYTLLVYLISTVMGCRYYVSLDTLNRRIVTFYGLKERAQIASYAYQVLVRQMNKARGLFLKKQSKRLKRATKITRGNLFCEGWVNGVYQLVDSFSLTDKEKKLLNAYKSTLDLTEIPITTAKTCNGGDNARYSGYQKGKEAKLHDAMNGSLHREYIEQR